MLSTKTILQTTVGSAFIISGASALVDNVVYWNTYENRSVTNNPDALVGYAFIGPLRLIANVAAAHAAHDSYRYKRTEVDPNTNQTCTIYDRPRRMSTWPSPLVSWCGLWTISTTLMLCGAGVKNAKLDDIILSPVRVIEHISRCKSKSCIVPYVFFGTLYLAVVGYKVYANCYNAAILQDPVSDAYGDRFTQYMNVVDYKFATKWFYAFFLQ